MLLRVTLDRTVKSVPSVPRNDSGRLPVNGGMGTMRHDAGTGSSAALTDDIVDGDTQTHNLSALEALYRDRYGDSVRLAHLMIGNRARAEKLAQDAFVRVLPKIATLDNPAGFLRTVLVNLCRDEGRPRSPTRTTGGHQRRLAGPPGPTRQPT